MSCPLHVHLFLGLMVMATGLSEAWQTLYDDILSGNFGGHHGVIVLGLWHLLGSVAEIAESFDYLEQGVEN